MQELKSYIHSFVAKDYHYFSPLFSIYGIKIAASLFKDDEYLEIWTSCNQTTKEINFCSKCSKCAFTYLVSLLYTSENFLRKFFSRDMLEDLSLFKILMDFTSDKPFDCVGEKIEVWVALDELSANKEFSDKKAIRYFQEKIKPFISGEMAQFKEEVYSLQKVPVDLPLDLQEIIKKAYEKK